MYIMLLYIFFFFFFSSRRRHTRLQGDWSSDVCSSDLEHEAILHLGRLSLRLEDEDRRGITSHQGDQSRAAFGDMLDVMKRDVDATRAAFSKEARKRVDAIRRVHFQLREIRIEDAQFPAREAEKPVEAFQIVAPCLEQNPLGKRPGGGLTHGAPRCEASQRGTNRAAAEGAAAGGARPAAGRARRRDARGIFAIVRAARPALR